jgi:glycosyltransferase involved in cell wall biosynthesis
LSSDSEEFPIAVVEAMSAGLPIVATAVGDIHLMVSNENRGQIVDRGDEAAFVRALARLVDRADIRMQLGRHNLHKARRDYQDSAMIATYADLYNGVIQERARQWRGARPAAVAISSIDAGSTPRFAK